MTVLDQTKQYLRVDYSDSDEIIADLISAAESHFVSIGIDLTVDPLPDAIHQAKLILVAHWYDGHDPKDLPAAINRLIAPYTEKTL